eukprot:scaffold5909_cov115-Skeletonema_dohrnii-CCMP3373.AAC.2
MCGSISGSKSERWQTLITTFHKKDPCSNDSVTSMPKVEFHVHLEGTLELEPELVFTLARRNSIDLSPYFKDVNDLRSKYESFTSLNSFLQVYYRCASVLRTDRDFYDATMAYLSRAKKVLSKFIFCGRVGLYCVPENVPPLKEHSQARKTTRNDSMFSGTQTFFYVP